LFRSQDGKYFIDIFCAGSEANTVFNSEVSSVSIVENSVEIQEKAENN
jgi:hypothetical protein